MLVGVLDVPAVTALGVLSAYSFQRRLRRASDSWYALLTALCVGLAWLGVIVANATAVPYGVVGLPVASVPPAVGLAYVLAYPLWFRVGGEAAFLLFGRRADQGGLVWMFRLADRTEPIAPSWRDGDVTATGDGEGRKGDESETPARPSRAGARSREP